jgi:nitrogen fixation protein NifU and related proteins
MSELTDLYQEVILDHNKRPRNFGRPASANRSAEGFNPLCGDHITVHLLVEGGVIREVAFEGSGCAVSKASASMMTEALKGRTEADAAALFETFRRLVTGCLLPEGGTAPLGKLAVFSGVSEFPTRVKCATLAWHTLRAALEGRHEAISTE